MLQKLFKSLISIITICLFGGIGLLISYKIQFYKGLEIPLDYIEFVFSGLLLGLLTALSLLGILRWIEWLCGQKGK